MVPLLHPGASTRLIVKDDLEPRPVAWMTTGMDPEQGVMSVRWSQCLTTLTMAMTLTVTAVADAITASRAITATATTGMIDPRAHTMVLASRFFQHWAQPLWGLGIPTCQTTITALRDVNTGACATLNATTIHPTVHHEIFTMTRRTTPIVATSFWYQEAIAVADRADALNNTRTATRMSTLMMRISANTETSPLRRHAVDTAARIPAARMSIHPDVTLAIVLVTIPPARRGCWKMATPMSRDIRPLLTAKTI